MDERSLVHHAKSDKFFCHRMYPLTENEKEQVSCGEEEEDDTGFHEDMEALRRACMLTGRDPDDIDKEEDDNDDQGFNEDLEALRRACMLTGRDPSDIDKDDDIDEDLELLNKIKNQISDSLTCKTLSLSTLPPATVCDDYQTLLAIRKRFAAYNKDTQDKSAEQNDLSCFNEEISTTGTEEGQPSTSENSGLIPKFSLAFLDAINKNRACQKFLQSALIHIQAKIEENKKLKQRVKILRDFQLHCKRRTGEALSQKKDPRVQLILTKRPRGDSIKPPHDDEDGAMSYGQEENSHVANYRMMSLKKIPDRKNWSEVEKKDLQKGIRQQFQEMVLQSSYSEIQDSNNDEIDKILSSIKDVQITPYSIREFLPKVNWQRLAAMYVPGHSGEECRARWLNCENPLINHEPWTVDEDKNILDLVQEKGVNDWIDIAAASLVRKGTNRTPFQCLARYQRSLNASILKHEWTKDDDAKLGSAVEAFGEGDWQAVASSLEGRTGTQCSNRWKKALHPSRTRKGKWTREEDTRLTVAQMLFEGSKNWNKISQFVPGRTQAQCRDRFVNSLEPSLKFGEWTEEEDSLLIAAIAEHGHCWSKISSCVPQRTDNMCWRRWKVLFPQQVLFFRQEKRIRNSALIRNFVDREEERPALGPNDFLPPDYTSNHPRKTGKGSQSGKKKNASSNCEVPKRHKNYGQICSDHEQVHNSNEFEACDGDDASKKKKKILKQRHSRLKGTEPTDVSQVVVRITKEHDAHKEPSEMSCSYQIIGTSDWDDTLASFFRKMKKRKLEVADFSV